MPLKMHGLAAYLLPFYVFNWPSIARALDRRAPKPDGPGDANAITNPTTGRGRHGDSKRARDSEHCFVRA